MLAEMVEANVVLVRVVYETSEPEVPEKAMEGMPSSAASHAAPLYIVVSGYLGYVFWRLTLFQTPGR